MSDNSDSTNERRITLGKIISYPVGALLLLTGLSVLVVGSFLSGVLIILSGALSLPIVRSKLKQDQGISLSRWATVAIVFTLVIAGGATMGDIGSDSDQPMETSEPTEEQTPQIVVSLHRLRTHPLQIPQQTLVQLKTTSTHHPKICCQPSRTLTLDGLVAVVQMHQTK